MMGNIFKLFFKKPLHRFVVLILLIFIFSPLRELKAQGDKKTPRILIVLDESSSMTLPWVQSKLRSTAAKELIMAIMDSVYSVNIQVEFALRAFGEQHIVKENNCTDTKLEVMFSQKNKTQMALRLDDLQQLGVTPIAYSLKEAAEFDMDDQYMYYYGLILITDGEESCDGNICDVVKNFLSKKINYKPYIINLTDNPKLRDAYDCMGSYLQTTTQSDIPKAAGIIKEAFKPELTKIVKKERPVVVAKPEPKRIKIPDVYVDMPEQVVIYNKLNALKRTRLAELEPERVRVRVVMPNTAVFKPEANLSSVLQPLKRLQLSEPEPDRVRVKIVSPDPVVYNPGAPRIAELKQLKRSPITEPEPERKRIVLATPDVAVYKPEISFPAIPVHQLKRSLVTELEPERKRIVIATPDVAVYKPGINIPAIPVQQLRRASLAEQEPERLRIKVVEPVVAIFDPELNIPPITMQSTRRILPDNIEPERTRLNLATPEVAIYKPEVNIPAIPVRNMPPPVVAEMEQDKLKFATPEVNVMQLASLGPIKMLNMKRPRIDITGEQVRLSQPYGVCVDNEGNIYISDNGNNRIRKVNTAGIISTIAGTGVGAYERDGVPAISTPIFKPRGIFVDDEGNIFFSDRNNHRVRRIDRNGIISTVAGTGVQGFTSDSGVAVKMDLYMPSYLVKNDKGELFLSDSGRLWKIDRSGIMTIIAGNGYSYTAHEADANYVRIVGDNGPAKAAFLFRPRGIVVDPEGNMYIADRGHFRIRKIDPNGKITTAVGTGEYGFQGDGARAKMAKLNELNDMVLAEDGTLYFTDGNMVRRLNTDGRIYIVAGTGRDGYTGDGGPATEATLSIPVSLALDKLGNLYIAEAWNHVIRKVDTKGIISTVAGCGKEGFMGDGLPAATGAGGK